MNEKKAPLPTLNVNVSSLEQKENELVKAEQLIGYYNEILDDIRDDRREIDEVLKTFLEMVINEGDASTSSKEALVNLMKLKADSADKKTKIIDLLMRAFMKDTSPRFLSANQHNEFRIEDSSRKRNLLKTIHEEDKNVSK